MEPKTDVTPQVSRRDLVRLGGVSVGVGAVAFGLVACGDDAEPTDTAADGAGQGGSGDATAGSGDATAGSDDAAAVITPLADVPVGGAVIAKVGDETIVVAQPEAGQVKGFSARCTHQGCIVTVKDTTTLECPCHLSTFDALTGVVTPGGQATSNLPSFDVTLEGENVVTA